VQFTYSVANNKKGVNAGTAFSDVRTVWALVKTNGTSQFVNGVNVEISRNIDFYIKYTTSIDFEKEIWVEFQNNRYEITDVENIDKMNELVRLGSVERGNKSIPANQR
jgi:SPP1 family predicted phage head-tail adaptor